MASAAVVEDVGARFIGHASSVTLTSRTTSDCRASVDFGWPVRRMIGTPRRLSGGRIASISSVSPEFDKASTTSPRATMPMSPWTPSAGCRKNAGVPVEASVAAILRPTRPDLPMPVTMTRAAQPWSTSTARSNRWSSLGITPRIASASMRSTRSARRRQFWLTCRPAPPGSPAADRAAAAGRRCAACWGRRRGAGRRPSCDRDPRASP